MISALPTSSWTPLTSTPGDQYSHERWQGRTVDGADAGQAVHVVDGRAPNATALPRGKPPRIRISMFSSLPSPAPPAQQKVCSRIVFSGISKKLLQTLLSTYRGSSRETHGPSRVARVVEGNAEIVVSARVELELVVADQIGRELADVDHLGRSGVVEDGAGER